VVSLFRSDRRKPDINMHTNTMEHRMESSQHIHWNGEMKCNNTIQTTISLSSILWRKSFLIKLLSSEGRVREWDRCRTFSEQDEILSWKGCYSEHGFMCFTRQIGLILVGGFAVDSCTGTDNSMETGAQKKTKTYT